MSRAFTKERDDAPEPALVAPRRIVGDLPPPPTDKRVVGLGSRVRVAGVAEDERSYLIVAPDESDIASGRLGLDSPLAQALLGKKKGNRVLWHRPAGDRNVTILEVTYEG